MKLCLFTVVMIGSLCVGLCNGETATFIYKNGKVEFGEFKKMSGDSVFLERKGNGGLESASIPKKSLSEVVFDSGDKLNLSLSEYPAPSASDAVKPAGASQARNAEAIVAAAPASLQIPAPSASPDFRSPFVYGGYSALIPGLGQALQGEPVKGAICFGVVGLSALGAMLAWNSTTTAYDNLQRTRAADGSWNDSDYKQFTFRLHGSQILTCASAVLYLLDIADATADAFAFDKRPSTGLLKPVVSVSLTGATCAFAF